jgi:uncharacterized protein (DUF2225 family)
MGEVRRAYAQCPVCSYVFRQPSAGTYVTVGRDSDLCPRFPGRRSDAARLIQNGLKNSVTLCPACSFAAAEDFAEITLVSDEREELRELLREDGLLKVFRAAQPSWLAFHAADLCGKERGYGYKELGDLCLRGSWVCRAEREQPFESTFQLRAIRYYIRALDDEPLDDRELSVTTYLVGELNRRLGHHREALNWYVNAERALTRSESRSTEARDLSWLDRLICRQRELAREEAA